MPLLIITIPLIVAFYFLMIRPQQQRVREHAAMVRTLEVGDEVITTAGVYGTITGLEDDVVRLEVAPGVEIRSARLAIGRRVQDLAAPAPTGEAPAPIEQEGDDALGGAA